LFRASIATSVETLHPLYWSLLTLTFEAGTDNLGPCIINLYCKFAEDFNLYVTMPWSISYIGLFTKLSYLPVYCRIEYL